MKAWGISSYGGTDPGITSGVVNIFSLRLLLTPKCICSCVTDGSVKGIIARSWNTVDARNVTLQLLPAQSCLELTSKPIAHTWVCWEKTELGVLVET